MAARVEKLYDRSKTALAGDLVSTPDIDWYELTAHTNSISSTNILFTHVSAVSKSVLVCIFVNSSFGTPSVTVTDGIAVHKLALMALMFFQTQLKEVC